MAYPAPPAYALPATAGPRIIGGNGRHAPEASKSHADIGHTPGQDRPSPKCAMTNYPVIAPNYFYRTGPMSCPYLPGRVERNLFTEIKGPNAQELHDRLASAGFRRSPGIVYRPADGDATLSRFHPMNGRPDRRFRGPVHVPQAADHAQQVLG